jgi:hypothetical protein
MNRHPRRSAMLLMLAALAAAVLLSSSLTNVQLGQGSPFPGAGSGAAQAEPDITAPRLPAGETLPAFRGLLAVGLLVLGILLLTRLASLTSPKRLLSLAAGIAVIILLMLSLPRIPAGGALELQPESPAPREPAEPVATSPLGTPPPSFMWIAGLMVVAAGSTVLIMTLQRQRAAVKLTEKVALQATRALKEIEAGADSTSVIIRCYLQMTTLIRGQLGISRNRALTVREFESALVSLGLPHEPLWILRRLFEAVRYGDGRMTAAQEQEAVASLNQIVSFLRDGTA